MKSLTITAPDDTFAQAITAICAQYGYQAKVPDPAHPGQQIDNPISQVDFAKSQVLSWLRQVIEAYAVKQASAAVDAARVQIKQQLDAVTSSVVATVV